MFCSLLQDDMEAYRTQNRFLNSEIHQVTRIWRKVAEKEKALLMKVRHGSPVLALSVPSHPSSPLTTSPLAQLSPHDLTALPLDRALHELSSTYQGSVLC